MKRKKKKIISETEQYIRSKRRIIWIVLAIAVAIIFSMVAITVVFCVHIQNLSPDTIIKVEIIEVGLAIIGLTVSVWAGLNIANAIDRRDVEEAVRRASELQNTTETIRNLSKEIKETQALVGRDSFLKALSKNDDSAIYFHRALKAKIDSSEFIECDFDTYNQLTQIEQMRQKILEKHSGQDKDDSDLRVACSNLIEQIEQTKERISEYDDFYEEYLIARKASCYHNNSFAFGLEKAEENRKAYEYLDYATKQYSELLKRVYKKYFGNPDNKLECYFNKQDQLVATKCNDAFDKFWAGTNDQAKRSYYLSYIENAGEAYNRMLYRKMKEYDSAEKAGKTVKLSEEDKEALFNVYKYAAFYTYGVLHLKKAGQNNEVYARNLGCVFERYGSLFLTTEKGSISPKDVEPYYKKALDNYIRAFRRASSNHRTRGDRVHSMYLTLLSCYNRLLRVMLDLSPNPSLNEFFSDEVKTRIKEESQKNRIVEHVLDFITASEIAVQDLPRARISHSMRGIAMIWSLLLINAGVKGLPEEYSECVIKNSIRQDARALQLIQAEDDYAKTVIEYARKIK